MAIAFLSEEKLNRARAEAKKTGGDLVEIYKKIGGAFVEGSNDLVEGTHKADAVFDEVKKAEKPKKKNKK